MTIAAIDATGLAMTGTPNICLYDSGGPTFMKRGDTYVVVGIHSLSDSPRAMGKAWIRGSTDCRRSSGLA